MCKERLMIHSSFKYFHNNSTFCAISLFIWNLEVIPLRTSGKRLPGKEIAIYFGIVIAVLVLSYNLSKDFSFILVSDKEEVFNLISVLKSFAILTINWFFSRSALYLEIVLAID